MLVATMSLACCISAGATEIKQPTFKDVPSTHEYAEEIEYIHSKGIINGIGDGKFNPDGYVTLFQMAVIVQRAFDTSGLTSGPMPVCFSNGWIPMATIVKPEHVALTRGEVYQIAFTAAGVDIFESSNILDWEGYIDGAKKLGLCADDASVNGLVTRAEVAGLIANLLRNEYKSEMPESMKLVKIVNNTTQNTGDYTTVFNKIPTDILKAFNDSGWTFRIDRAPINAYNFNNGATAVGLTRYYCKDISVVVPGCVIHEFGHFLAYYLNNFDKCVELYSNEGTKAFALLGHASENHDEYFADMFNYYIMHRDDGKISKMEEMCPDTFEYLQSLEAKGWVK